MAPGHQIDYGTLIDRSIKDFQPVKRLWPAGVRLACWILLEAAILSLAVWVRGPDNLRALSHDVPQLGAVGLFIVASIATAFLALKSAIPGRELTWAQLAMAIALIAAALSLEPPAGGPLDGLLKAAPTSMLQLFGLAALPWLALFLAARRGVPMQPRMTGAAIGLAGLCFAVGLRPIITEPAPVPASGTVLALAFTVVTVLSVMAGQFWLNWIARWQQKGVAAEVSTRKWAAFNSETFFPLALGASIVALIFVLRGPGPDLARVPDFDLAIETYERAVVDFRPNVPSASMEKMLTAYVEHGMPAYMWDFGPEGFKLVGGRWDPLSDGTPVTYTWFRGKKGGVMCMFRQTDVFNPPSIAHDEDRHLLFYRYRGFSFCLINVGGYGNFISVIAAPMPLNQFEHLVLAATL